MENMLSLWSRNVSRLLLKLRGGNHVVKKINNITKVLAFVLVLSMVTTSLSPAYAGWRSSKTAKKNGYTLGAYANLPYWADKDGGGDWKTKASYGAKVKLTNSWEFYTIGVHAHGVVLEFQDQVQTKAQVTHRNQRQKQLMLMDMCMELVFVCI